MQVIALWVSVAKLAMANGILWNVFFEIKSRGGNAVSAMNTEGEVDTAR